jgi:hypothetical protein
MASIGEITRYRIERPGPPCDETHTISGQTVTCHYGSGEWHAIAQIRDLGCWLYESTDLTSLIDEIRHDLCSRGAPDGRRWQKEARKYARENLKRK